MKKIFAFLCSAALIGIMASCEITSSSFSFVEDDIEGAQAFLSDYLESSVDLSQVCDTPQFVNVYAGQHIFVGNAAVFNDEENLYVGVATTGGWMLKHTHIYVGDLEGVPANGAGNPKIGNFPFQTAHDPYVDAFLYTFPLSDVPESGIVALHAEAVLLDENGSVTQSETAWADGPEFVEGGSWASYFEYEKAECTDDPVVEEPEECIIEAGDYRTQTQGGWGSKPNGGNNGVYLHANFDAAFPNGLVIGCDHTLALTNAQAITDLLPEGGPASALDQSYTDPSGDDIKNVFVGQVVALSLSVGFDAYDADFGASEESLASLKVAEGDFAGWTVEEVLTEAQNALGGCGTQSVESLNEVVSSINENFVDGTANEGFLTCGD